MPILAPPQLNNGVSIKAPTAYSSARSAWLDDGAGNSYFGQYNFNDLSNLPTFGSAAYVNTNYFLQTSLNLSDVPSPSAALSNLGISGVYAPLANPAFSGNPTAPTQATSDSSTNIATTAFVKNQSYLTGITSTQVTSALGYTPVSSATMGAANGVATLDGAGTLTASQIPASIRNPMIYKGNWDASINSPALASGVGTQGWMYTVSVAGLTTLDGISTWNVGDKAVFNGTAWEKIDGLASEVTSVCGRVGAVTIQYTDLPTIAPYSYIGNSTSGSTNPAANTSLILGATPFSTTGNLVAGQFTGSTNSVFELIVQNTNSGRSSSSDIVATADTGNDGSEYIDFGINSSTGGIAPFTNALAAYCYTDQAELDIGALSTSSPAVNIYAGGGTSSPTKQIGVTTAATTFYNQIASAIAGSLTASNPGFVLSQTWNNAAVNFYGATINITPTAQGTNSRAFAVQNSGTDKMWVDTTGDIWANGSITSANSFVNQTAGNYSWNSRSKLVSGSDGSITLLNSGGTGFTSLLLGGSTSSQAGLFTSGTTTKFRLADNSADSPITCSSVAASGVVSSTGAGAASTSQLLVNGTWFVSGSNSTNYPAIYLKSAGATDFTFSTSGEGLAVNGPSGYAGTLARCGINGSATHTLSADGSITITGQYSTNKSAASTAAITTTAAPYSAGTGTTCFPQWFATWGSPTAQTNWSNGSNNGTVFGGLGPSTFTGNWIDLRLGSSATATPAMLVTYAGAMTLASTIAASNLSLGGKLITAGAATLSGAYAFTGTLTAATTVTFPTTGTLAILGANTFTVLQTLSPASGIAAYVTAGAIETFTYPNGNSSTAIALQLDNGNQQSLTISAACSITLSTPTHPGSFRLYVTNNGFTWSFTTSILWLPSATQPTWSTTNTGKDCVSLAWDGTNWWGSGGTGHA